MTVEITISDRLDWTYTNFGVRMYETAVLFSGMTNFNIIDCYSSAATPTRYNGDPIADGIWTSGADVANDNSWFVIECVSTLYPSLGLPRWQAKYQWTNAAGFADVSGINYDMETDIRVVALRFAPYGGWDLDPSTPDFTGPSGQKSGKNKKLGFSVVQSRNIFFEDDGQFMHLIQNGIPDTNNVFRTLTTVMGDFNPTKLDSQPMPRLHINGFDDPVIGPINNNSWLCEEQYWSNTLGTSWDDTTLGVGYQNPSNVWTEESFKTNTTSILVNKYSQPAPNRSPIDTTIKPYQICTYSNGLIGEIPALGKFYGVGQRLLSSRNWLSMGAGLCLAMKWEPSVNL